MKTTLPKKNYLAMNTQAVKQTLHELIDQIEDEELLAIYLQLLERELRKNTTSDFFNTTESELIARAKALLKSVREGNTRSITEFRKDVEAWKNKRAI
ncbi:MAG: hypothetical protein AAF519_14095 [Bacteroidota bacterium]